MGALSEQLIDGAAFYGALATVLTRQVAYE